MKVIGFEAANSFVKIKSDKYAEPEAYLNTVRELTGYEEAAVDDEVLGGAVEDTIFRINGVSYTVGNAKDAGSSSGRGVDRYDTPLYKIASLIAIARHVDNGDEVLVVTGVPAQHYKTDRAATLIEQALKGEHTVYINGNPVTFNVKEVRVMLQPLGSYNTLLKKDDGSLKERAVELSKKEKLLIDIGWGSTDVAVLEGAMLRDFFTIDVSMFNAYEAIGKGLEKAYPDIVEAGGYNEFDLEKQLRESNVFEIGNVPYNALAIKQKAFETVANNIMAEISRKQINLKKYGAVIFTGGGVLALAPYLRKFTEDVPNVLKVVDAQMANARGYYISGKYRKK